jgi:hypothetical protein
VGCGVPPLRVPKGRLALLLILTAAAPAAAADLPDTSERFREAMSACTLPGPGLGPRLDRLAETGWTASVPDAADALAFRDADLLAQPPATWDTARDDGPVALPDTVFRNGEARLIVWENSSGAPACRLATLNSTDSDLLLSDLAAVGAVTEDGPLRRAAMATSVYDTATGAWRTEVRLSSADTDAANARLDDPLRATLAVSFVTRPLQ